MGKDLPVPKDDVLGAPLPIWVDPSFNHFRGIEHYHKSDRHHDAYPKRRYCSEGGLPAILADPNVARRSRNLGLRSRRAARQEIVPRRDHGWWHDTYTIPVLSDDPLDVLAMTILLRSGYLPNEAVAFSRYGEERTVPLSDRQRVAMQKRLVHEESEVIARYLLQYALAHGPEPHPRTLDKFHHGRDSARHLTLGAHIIQVACREATRPLQELYWEARGRGFLSEEQPHNVGHCMYNIIASTNIVKPDEPEKIYPDAIVWLAELLTEPQQPKLAAVS